MEIELKYSESSKQFNVETVNRTDKKMKDYLPIGFIDRLRVFDFIKLIESKRHKLTYVEICNIFNHFKNIISRYNYNLINKNNLLNLLFNRNYLLFDFNNDCHYLEYSEKQGLFHLEDFDSFILQNKPISLEWELIAVTNGVNCFDFTKLIYDKHNANTKKILSVEEVKAAFEVFKESIIKPYREIIEINSKRNLLTTLADAVKKEEGRR